MGAPIARHLVLAGHAVRAYDIDPAAAERTGAKVAASPAEAAAGASFVAVIVFDDAQATEVVTAVLPVVSDGAVVAVHTTTTMGTIEQLGRLAERASVDLLDAGISGGESGAEAGTLLVLVGGAGAALDRVRPLMDVYAKEVVHAGRLGSGMALKLARNATGYAMMGAVQDAIELAMRTGVDQHVLQHVIAETGVAEQALSTFILDGLPQAQAEHLDRLATKDLDAALDLARHVDAPSDVFTATRAMFRRVARVDR
jgi:3-hydroxyisobutyrate dehydrogenase-like beta-hydroxyacid dehydrogenase